MYQTHKHTQATAFFGETLEHEAVREYVALGNRLYKVVGSTIWYADEIVTDPTIRAHVLRITYAKTLAKRNPIMALAGTDLSELKRSGDDLREFVSAFNAYGQTLPRREEPIENIFPSEFLIQLADTERARRLFITYGRDGDLSVYEKSLHRSIWMQRKYVARIQDYLRTHIPSNIPAYVTSTELVTYENLMQDIQTLFDRTQITQRAIKEFSQCIRMHTYACNQNDIGVPHLEIPEDAPLHISDIKNIELVRTFYTDVEIHLETPSFVLSDSACLDAETPPVFAFQPMDSNEIKRIFSIGDVRFIDMQASEIPVFVFMRKNGIAYTPGRELNHYSCLRLDSDVGRTYALRNIYHYIQHHPVSTHAAGSEHVVLKEFEQKILQTNLLYEQDALGYLKTALTLIGTSLLPTHVEDALLDLHLQWTNRSAGFDMIPRDIARSEIWNLNVLYHGSLPEINHAVFLFTRNGLLPLNAAHNISFGPVLSTHPDPLPTQLEHSPHRYLSSILSDYGYANIVHDMETFLSYYNILYE